MAPFKQKPATLALLALILSACSTMPDKTTAPEDSWRLKGKLGVSHANDSESALLDWLDCGRRWQIRLLGPLGTTGALIEGGDDEAVWLKVSGREPVTARSVDTMATSLGWPMPVSGLRHWVQGRPSPDAPYDAGDGDPQGRLTTLEQLGWMIRFDRYDEQGELPGRVRLQRQDLKVTILKREWDSPAAGCGALLEAAPRS